MNVEIGLRSCYSQKRNTWMGFSLQCTFPLKGKKQFLLSDKTDGLGRGAHRLKKNYDNGGDGLFSPLLRGWTPLCEGGGGGGRGGGSLICRLHLLVWNHQADKTSTSVFQVIVIWCVWYSIWSGAVGIATALGGIADDKMMSMPCLSRMLLIWVLITSNENHFSGKR